MKPPLPLLFMLLLIFLVSCKNWDFEKRDFPQIELLSLDEMAIDSILAKGRIADLELGQASDHGFVWSASTVDPTVFINEGNTSLGLLNPGEDLQFEAMLTGFKPETSYTIRAYLVQDEEVYYSLPKSVHTGGPHIFTEPYLYESGYEVSWRGRLTGIQAGIVATKHGFCWSSTQTEPDLSDAVKDFGTRFSDGDFSHKHTIQFNGQTFYVRAFAIVLVNQQPDTLFGDPVVFSETLVNAWKLDASFPQLGRADAVSFCIGQKGYVCGGRNGLGVKNDLWEFDPATSVWTQKANLPGPGRSRAWAFSVGEKGYVGGGEENFTFFYDFWAYDPQTNSWTGKTNLSGAQCLASTLVIQGKAYLLDFSNEFFEYDPAGDQWAQKASPPEPVEFSDGAEGRIAASTFSIDNKGYLAFGGPALFSAYFDYTAQIAAYDPQTNTWELKAPFPQGRRGRSVGFSLGGKGYIATGEDINGYFFNDLWSYDPVADSWQRKADLPGPGRIGGITFQIDDRAWVGLGSAFGSLGNPIFLPVLYEYIPD